MRLAPITRWINFLAVDVVLAALCLGCAPAMAQTALKLSLDPKVEGPAAPFLLPFDKGYYKSEGLDVILEPVAAAPDTIARVAAGTSDIGFADINALIVYRDQNPAAGAKAVFIVYNKSPYAIIARKSRNILDPKDLEGKKLGATATDAASPQWKIFAKANGIDVTKVTLENVGAAVREPMLAAGQVDAVMGYTFSSFVDLKDRGVAVNDIVLMQMAEYGVDLYGHAIIVNEKFAAAKPEAVKAFLRALTRGIKDTIKDPVRAVESVIKRNEGAKKELELERLRIALHDDIVTSEVKANGLGGVDINRLSRTIDEIGAVAEFKAKPKAENIFDPAFLPPAAERKIP